MMTIKVAENVTMTLTNRTAEKWFAYKDAVDNYRLALHSCESLDWWELDDLETEVWEAWEQFCS